MDKEVEYLKLEFESYKTNMLMFGSMSTILLIGGYSTMIGLASLGIIEAFYIGIIIVTLGLCCFILMIFYMVRKYFFLKNIRDKLISY